MWKLWYSGMPFHVKIVYYYAFFNSEKQKRHELAVLHNLPNINQYPVMMNKVADTEFLI